MMHAEAHEFVAREVARRGPFDQVLEFGSRYINGGVKALFNGCSRYVGTDIADGPGVDMVIDATEWTDGGFDCVVCCEVLEHTPKGDGIIQAATRALSGGGVFLMTCATDGRAPHSAVDGGPLVPGEFYRNVPAVDAVEWLAAAGFREFALEVWPWGDLYVAATYRP